MNPDGVGLVLNKGFVAMVLAEVDGSWTERVLSGLEVEAVRNDSEIDNGSSHDGNPDPCSLMDPMEVSFVTFGNSRSSQ